MRLYKMELYKICSKKLFLFSALASIAILLLFFWSQVIGTESTVDGVKYTGYQAVQMDRAITEEFRGELTDQKVTQIVEKYGFPNGVSEDHNVFLYRNYLNDLVMHRFSDGYFYDWDDYHVGTCTYPIAETDLGKAGAATGKTLLLEYSYGWQVFAEMLQTGCIAGIALIALALAPVFSEEDHINMRQILFTTREGRNKDVIAKIAAGMTVAIGVYAVIVILDLVLVWCVFGLDGWNCIYSQVMDDWISDLNNYHNASTDYMRDFIRCFLFACFLGMAEAGAISLYFSAHCKSSFQSVIATAMSFLVPLLLFMLSNMNGVLIVFICNMFILALLGIAIMCFVPDITNNKVFTFAAKSVCCVFPIVVGYFLRKRFLFYVALPVWLIMINLYWDMGMWRTRYPWMPAAVYGFAAALSVIFVVCSWKKYRRL